MSAILILGALRLVCAATPSLDFVAVTTEVTSTETPLIFQTTPEVFAGPTATGPEPFLIQTNPAPLFPNGVVSYNPPSPLETQEPIYGAPVGAEGNIFHQMGNISPYHASPGFGVSEFPLLAGANVSWLNMLHRHGSRYPTDPISLGSAIAAAKAKGAKFSGQLSFLNTWSYTQGVNILTPWGRQECYDSGVLHNIQYGGLYSNESTTKLVARTTTMDRMRKTAENFLAGFFGLGWNEYANIDFIIDEPGYNNSLAGYNACPNNNNFRTAAGANASDLWIETYSKAAVSRLNNVSSGFEWNASLVYDAQEICAYETVSVGYSSFCDLFTFQEWTDFEQAIDISFYGTYGFGSPTGRAVGIGYVEEVLARINHHVLTTVEGSANITYADNNITFPTNQTLNFDFSHDVNIFAVLTAFGMKQLSGLIPNTTYDPNRHIQISNMIPFACRLDIVIIDAPSPISTNATAYESGNPTKYITFKLNQRTLPLYESYPSCGLRADGWCELSTWLATQANATAEANYDYACYGNYTAPKYGEITNGAIYQ